LSTTLSSLSTTSLLVTETSPDNRDNEIGCVIHSSTEVILDSVTVLICLFGLVGNGVVLWLLKSFCLDKFWRFVRVIFHLLFLFATNAGLYFLTAISIERCLSVSSTPFGANATATKHLSALVCALLWALSCLVTGLMSYFCVSVGSERCRMSHIAMYVLNFLIFAPVMVLSNLILFIKVRHSSQQRQPGRLYVVILLTVLFFLVFAVPFSIHRFGLYYNYFRIPIEICNALASVNSSINPVIYFLVGSYRKWRVQGSVKVALQEAGWTPSCEGSAT
uniref:G-protein coupled receptors family 1 profile domain-containing protein n=1 Tax=Gopherus evgoodei TaxID=1825980 RepID=A0A8C4W4I2_9SAUR